MKCPKCSGSFESKLTHAGVVIDVCNSCKGVWLERGEINFFSRNAKSLQLYEIKGLENKSPAIEKCSKCNVGLHKGKIPGFKYEVEECAICKGLFLDSHEFEKIQLNQNFNKFTIDNSISFTQELTHSQNKRNSIPIRLPSLGLASTVILGSMYGFLFGVILFLIEMGRLPYLYGLAVAAFFVFAQFVLGPLIMDWSLRLFGSLEWIETNQLPTAFQNSLKKICKKENLPEPRIGIIHDSSPQAYTYGRSPWSARVVFSKGIFEILNEDEVETVLAHELGHVKHWDFVVMTLAQLVPILFYHIYRICLQSGKKSSSRGKGGKKGSNGTLVAAGVVAYFAHHISQYLVMYISRLREYYADQFSGRVTQKPNALLSALVKIGYGLVASGTSSENDSDRGKKLAVQSMGIMNISSSRELALSMQGESDISKFPKHIKEIMRWDMWSPWALYYELHSTHPLTAKRINAIGNQALQLGQTPAILFDLKKPESYWDDFFSDLFVLLMPLIFGIVPILSKLILFPMNQWNIPDMIVLFSIGMAFGGLLRTSASYPTRKFRNYSVSALLRKIKVSPVRSFAVKLRGKVIGRGDSGNVLSEDLMLKDHSGIIFLDHEPFGFNFFFALFRVDEFQGKEVELEGWYRRAPVPFVEIKTIRTVETISRSFTYYYKVAGWIIFPFFIVVLVKAFGGNLSQF